MAIVLFFVTVGLCKKLNIHEEEDLKAFSALTDAESTERFFRDVNEVYLSLRQISDCNSPDLFFRP
jgi:hypothetical protein